MSLLLDNYCYDVTEDCSKAFNRNVTIVTCRNERVKSSCLIHYVLHIFIVSIDWFIQKICYFFFWTLILSKWHHTNIFFKQCLCQYCSSGLNRIFPDPPPPRCTWVHSDQSYVKVLSAMYILPVLLWLYRVLFPAHALLALTVRDIFTAISL